VVPSNHVPPERSVPLEDASSFAVGSDSEDDIAFAHYHTHIDMGPQSLINALFLKVYTFGQKHF